MGRIRSISGGPTGVNIHPAGVSGSAGPTGHQGPIGQPGYDDKREKIIRKWTPIVENNIPTRNKKIIEYCALYCEWYLSIDENYTKNSAGEDLNSRLEEIKKRIVNIDRIDIVGKSYNPISGEIEYKLSNGKYIPLTGMQGNNNKLSDEQLTTLFDIEFIKEINIQLYRDLKIGKIIC